MQPRALFALLAALAIGSLTRGASAYCRTTTDASFTPSAAEPCPTSGAKLYWATSCVGYSMQKSASIEVTFAAAEATMVKAALAWQSPHCPTDTVACTGDTNQAPSMKLEEIDPVTCACAEYNKTGANANVIVFRDKAWADCNGVPKPGADTIIALTTVTYAVDSGEIYDADMELNSAHNAFTTSDVPGHIEFDLQSVMTHEAGHMMGLAHTQPDNVDATMYAEYRLGETKKRVPKLDDICGLCNAYPPGRAAGCNTQPRRGFSPDCDAGATAPDPASSSGCHCNAPGATPTPRMGWLAAAGLAIAATIRRRPKR